MILSVIAVLTLGLIGYGYAAWPATVITNAMVSTGTLVLGIAVAGTTDEPGTMDLTWGDPTSGEPGTTAGLDVGSLTDANAEVGTSVASLGANSTFYGTILANASITTGAGAESYGWLQAHISRLY